MVVKVNVLVSIFYDEEWIEILNRLGFDIGYIAGLPEYESKVPSSCLYEKVSDFLSGIEETGDLKESPQITDIPKLAFDFNLLRDLSEYEFVTKYMINREYDHGFDITNEIYFEIISYWLKIIDRVHPTLVVVPYTPYTAREFVLYALTQVLNIPFISFRRATVGYYLNIPFSNPMTPEFPEVVAKYRELKSSAHPFWIQDYANQKMRKISDPQVTSVLDDANIKLKSTVDYSYYTLLKNYFTETKRSVVGQDIVPSIKKIWFDIKNLPGILDTAADFAYLKSYYDSKCINPDYSRPYIFFPVHYQPEQTTSPFGSYSVYQYLPIEMLARCLPEDWLVYVKEHHTTFSPFHGGIKKRTDSFYDRLSNNPNVRLIKSEVQSATLIDNAKAVATITGSAGYEALLRNKPVLTFGSAWYNGCEGVYNIKSHNQCQAVLESIRKGITINPVDFLLFVQATESVGAKVNYSLSMSGIGDSTVTREDTISNMVALISRWCAARNIIPQ